MFPMFESILKAKKHMHHNLFTTKERKFLLAATFAAPAVNICFPTLGLALQFEVLLLISIWKPGVCCGCPQRRRYTRDCPTAVFCNTARQCNISFSLANRHNEEINTLRTGDADLRFYVTTVQDGWRKSAFLTSACFPCTVHLIMQNIEPVSEWSCLRMFVETWPHSELNFRHRASSI